MDKDARALLAWHALGFGFTELGAVTWHPQPGNERPRIFRAIPEEAIVNRMGFNNAGAVAVAAQLAQLRAAGLWPAHPVGINLGKSRVTPLDQAAADYAGSFRVLRAQADFFVVNVSSPNTPNLRQLQDRSALDEILAAVQELNSRPGDRPDAVGQRATPAARRPILVKVAPDLTFDALDDLLSVVETRGVAGIIATNTTITRPSPVSAHVQHIYAEPGGLSGRPLRQRSTEVIAHLYRQSGGRLPIVGVGGIFNADDAWEKIEAGASLLQVYTGLVYEGPSLACNLVRGLTRHMQRHGFDTLRQAVGCGITKPTAHRNH
jgi:dihydroorotate dehydrogenase